MQQHKQAESGHQRNKKPAPARPGNRSDSNTAADRILALQRSAGNQAANHAISELRPATSRGPIGDLPREVEQGVRGQGQPLEPNSAAEMSARFGRDFSHVRLHTGSSAGASAQALHARAYTVGSDIVFGPGRYVPGTVAGQQLLAHELTHVVQQSNGGSQAPNHVQYGQAEREASAAASQAGPANVSQAVATGTIQADDDGWFDIVTTAALGPVAALALPDDAGSWILGAIGGEFTDDPTYGQIGVDFVLSIIPYVDQVADARDLIAHIYRLGFRGEYTSVLRWIALVFTLIGLIPEVGSVVKSLSKAVIRFAGRNLDTVLRLVRRLIDLLPKATGGLSGVRRYIASHWDDWARFGRGVWDTLLAKGGDLVDALTSRLAQVLSLPGFVLAQGKRFLITRLSRLRQMSALKLPEFIKQVKDKVLSAVDDIAERLGARTTPTGGPGSQLPARQDPLQVSAGGGGGGGRTTTIADPVPDAPTGATPHVEPGDVPAHTPPQRADDPPTRGRDTPSAGREPPGGLPGTTGTRHLPREFRMPRHNETTFPSTSRQIGTAEQRAAGRVRRRGERVGRGEQGTQVTEIPRGRTGARDHWHEHGDEFPEYRNARQYERGAVDFCRDPATRRFYYQSPGGRPTVGYYNVETNSFAATSVDGRTVFTYFRPDNAATYVRNIRHPPSIQRRQPPVTPRHSTPTRQD